MIQGQRFLQSALAVLFLVAVGAAQAQAGPDALHAWVGATTPEALTAWVSARLADEKKDVDAMLAVKGERTVENTVRPFDDAQNELAIAGDQAFLLYSLADGAPMRDKAQAELNRISSAGTDLSLNQGVYRALAEVPLPTGSTKDDLATKHYIERSLLEYRLSGVDKDEATRAKIHALQDKITAVSLTFGRNVANDVKKVSATKQELAGLPTDYIARHKPNADGTYTITTDQPDVGPVEDFSTSPDLRRRVYIAYHSRAYPANEPVLRELLETREELAHTLGYATYADLATADQMIGSANNLKAFLDQVNAATKQTAAREYQELLAFAQKRQPGLTEISDADARYWAEQYRKATYDFDAQSVRPYFPYAQVEAGILSTASKLFHVSFQRVPDAIVWDKSVTTYDVLDGGKRIGRIYLDMHPREGKDKWFSSGPVVPGIRGRQMPEGMLICNFSGGVPGDPGLMEYNDVVTFFHEFGHLMHHILGSQNEWSQQGGFNVEGDFVEAPSQMLEEMFRSYAVLAPFAKNYKTGATIPESLVARMNAAGAYGRGSWVQAQLFYSTYSLQLHDQPAAQLNFDGIWREDHDRFEPTVFVPGDHDFASFTHLTGYASNYYTYVLDKVIAVDFFSQFDPKNLLNGPTAMRYRRTVLEPGATKPAAQLVKDFLGRPQSIDALKTWVNVEFTDGQGKTSAIEGK
ncbi:MAG TPA: M3 family metallopeptidase [Candidatus Aquilonibacter sp.]|nr:M3 family metallopeptidase [Candidatus Aquilonibacter sp.]